MITACAMLKAFAGCRIVGAVNRCSFSLFTTFGHTE